MVSAVKKKKKYWDSYQFLSVTQLLHLFQIKEQSQTSWTQTTLGALFTLFCSILTAILCDHYYFHFIGDETEPAQGHMARKW